MSQLFGNDFVNGLRKRPFIFELYVLCLRVRSGISRKVFKEEVKEYERLNKSDKFHIQKGEIYPRLYDRNEEAGKVDDHYFLQDIYFARKVLENKPAIHYDIGSRVDGFIAHLLSGGQKVVQLDIRPLGIMVEGLEFLQADATELNDIEDNSIDSLSSLHAVEHFGLGRYGDKIDPDAWRKVLGSISRKLKEGGILYLSVPIGKNEKVCFNAHRIYNPRTIQEALSDLDLISFAYIHNAHIISADISKVMDQGVLGDYDCGMFIFRKKPLLMGGGILSN